MINQNNGEDLGCLKNYSDEHLYKELFPKSKIVYFDTNVDLLYNLLLENLQGFLTDDLVAKNYAKKFPDRITYYDMNIPNEFAFAFRKGENSLLEEFNEFLKTQDLEKLYEKWNVNDTFNLKIEKDNYIGKKTIKVGFFFDSKPFCYLENREEKGIDMDLLYQFAKSQNYSVNLIKFTNSSDRMKIGEKDTDFDITGGEFSITEKRAETVSFSDPYFKLGIALVVRTGSKKDTMKLTIFDHEYNEIPDNKAKVYAKVGNKTLTSLCAFPNTFNDTFSIKCEISDFNGTDPYTQGIEFINTTDILRIVYSDLEIDNILKANDKLNLPIIQESNKTEYICPKKGSSSGKKIALIAVGGITLLAVLLATLKLCL